MRDIRSHVVMVVVTTKKFVLDGLLGKVSIALNIDNALPKDHSDPDDVEAAERYLQMNAGWFANAIFLDGDYPDIMKTQLAKIANLLGLDRSPLPEFTEDEKRYNRGKLV